MISRRNNSNIQTGSILLVTLIGLVVLTLIGIAFLSQSSEDLKASANIEKKTDISYALESALSIVRKNFENMLLAKMRLNPVQGSPLNAGGRPVKVKELIPSMPYNRANFINSDCPSSSPPSPSAAECAYLADKFELSHEQFTDATGTLQDSYGFDKLESMFSNVNGDNPYYANKNYQFNIAWTIEGPIQDLTAAGTDYVIPSSSEGGEYAGWEADRWVDYQVLLSASSQTGVTKNLEATISVYEIYDLPPIFSDETITLTPGEPYKVSGRIHSNGDVRAGNDVIFYPNKYNPGEKSLTSARNIWHLFHFDEFDANGGPTASYGLGSGVNTATTNASTFEKFTNHLLGTEDKANCATTPNCWVDDLSTTEGYKWYSTKVDAEASDFYDRMESKSHQIKTLWMDSADVYNDHNDPAEEDIPYSFILEPPKAGEKFFETAFKKYYRADIKIVDGVSYKPDGSTYDPGDALSYESLVNVKILIPAWNDQQNCDEDCKKEGLYVPMAGRIANVTYLDIAALKTAVDTIPAFQGINHIYIGTNNPPSGQVQFPGPGCDGPHNTGYEPICWGDNNKECTSACLAENIGTFNAVMIKNGSELPQTTDSLSISTNELAFVQGNFNTVNSKPVKISSEAIEFLSNSWDKTYWSAYNKVLNKWDPYGPPPVNEEATYKLKYMTSAYQQGFELPLMESWYGKDSGGDYTHWDLNRYMSAQTLWKPSKYSPVPPRAGNPTDGYKVFNNWHKRAWASYYDPATWNIYPLTGALGGRVGDDDDAVYFVKIHSLVERDSNDIW